MSYGIGHQHRAACNLARVQFVIDVDRLNTPTFSRLTVSSTGPPSGNCSIAPKDRAGTRTTIRCGWPAHSS
jgi:hypothetical protein